MPRYRLVDDLGASLAMDQPTGRKNRQPRPFQLLDQTKWPEAARLLNEFGRDVRFEIDDLQQNVTVIDRHVTNQIREVIEYVDGHSPAYTPVLWQWNGVDTSQFGSLLSTVGVAGSAALSVVADATTGRNMLKLAATSLASGAFFAPLAGVNAPRGVLQVRIQRLATGTSSVHRADIMFTGNGLSGASMYGFCLEKQNANSTTVFNGIEAGAFTLSAGTTGATFSSQQDQANLHVVIDYQAVSPVVTTPYFTYVCREVSSFSGNTLQHESSVAFTAPAPAAGWNAQSLSTPAIGIRNNSVTPRSMDLYFDQLVLLKHPMDL